MGNLGDIKKSTISKQLAYPHEFFTQRVGESDYTAKTVFDLLEKVLPSLKSTVDIGCGTGTWLANFKKLGVPVVLGYDGKLLDLSLLEISRKSFICQDLTKPIVNPEKFDLAICLEVAEHLPEQSAKTLVDSLCSLSDFILFSAAIPGQGGLHHLNEQWQEYWVAQFENKGFVAFDYIRPRIWNDSKIQFWYKQNILIFAKSERSGELNEPEDNCLNPNLVHPDLHAHKCEMDGATEKFSLKDMTSRILKKFFP